MAGIESLVQNKMAAFRGDPAQLEQSYQLNQQLVDLLALQKLKSDKDAAARDMQLKMAASQGTPPTIMEQRQNELMDHTRNEIAQQVGATGQQQAAEQQALMQQMMGGGGQEGIAGYAGGGKVRHFDQGGWNDPQMTGTRASSPLAGIISWLKRREEEARRYKETGSRKRPFVGPPILPTSAGIMQAVPQAAPEVEEEEVIEAAPMERSRVQDTDLAPPAAQPPNPNDTLYDDAIARILDPNAAQNRATEERGVAERYLGVPAEVTRQQAEYQNQLADLDAQQLSPKKLARQRLIAFLLGAGRGHNLGAGLNIGGQDSMAMQGQQEADERNRMVQRQGIVDAYNKLTADSQASIYNAGAAGAQAQANQVSTALNAVSQERTNRMTADERAADRAQQVQLEQMREAAAQALEQVRNRVLSKDRAVTAYAALQSAYDRRLQAIVSSAQMLGLDPSKEIAELETQYGPLLMQLQSEMGVEANTGEYLGVEE